MLSRRSLVLALAGLGAIIGALLLFQPDGTSSSPLQLGGGAKPLFVPVAVSYQGGGWRAMFACMGVTRALSRAGVFGPEYARQLQVLSSNSGGSWFLSQLAYSESFYGNVTGEEHQVAQMVHDWMGKQRSQLQPPSEKVIENLKQWLGSTSLEGRALVLIFKLVDWFRKRPLLTSLLCWSVRKQWAACELMLSATVGGISLGAETQGSWYVWAVARSEQRPCAPRFARPPTSSSPALLPGWQLLLLPVLTPDHPAVPTPLTATAGTS